MTRVITHRSTENMEYVRRLLNRKQPGFSAVLELAVMIVDLELWPPQPPHETSAAKSR